MREFIALVHKDVASAYGISFPDLPGCFSAADNKEDVEAKVKETLALWFEDVDIKDIQPATNGDELTRLFAAELRNSAFPVLVSYAEHKHD